MEELNKEQQAEIERVQRIIPIVDKYVSVEEDVSPQEAFKLCVENKELSQDDADFIENFFYQFKFAVMTGMIDPSGTEENNPIIQQVKIKKINIATDKRGVNN